MRFREFASLVLLASGPAFAAPHLKESVRPLLGQWVCIAWTYNGKANDPDPCVWEFGAAGKLLRRLGDSDPDPAERRYAADPTATPARLDWTDGEDTVEAIYRVEEDTLTVCYSHNPADDRPTRFESSKGSRLVVLTFKRVKHKDSGVPDRAGSRSPRRGPSNPAPPPIEPTQSD